MYSYVCVSSDQMIAAGAPRKYPRLTVNCATLACLLYPTHYKLITSFNNSKTKRRTKFCQRKNRFRIDSRMCHFTDNRVILNHPVYIKTLLAFFSGSGKNRCKRLNRRTLGTMLYRYIPIWRQSEFIKVYRSLVRRRKFHQNRDVAATNMALKAARIIGPCDDPVGRESAVSGLERYQFA